MRVAMFLLWNFSIGRALANLSANFFRFAAFLKKSILGLRRCTRSSREISCSSWTTGSTLSLPRKSPPHSCNWSTSGIVAWSLMTKNFVEMTSSALTFSQIWVFRLWSLFTAFQVSKIIILAKRLIPYERTGVFAIAPLKCRMFLLSPCENGSKTDSY